MKSKKIKEQLISTFILSICVFLAISIGFKIYNIFPFGTDSLFVSDLYGQYADFSLFFRDSTFWEKIYSFSKGLGGETTGLVSYYTSSPFNIILYLFKAENIEVAIFTIISMKIICMALSMYIYLSYHYKNNFKNAICAFSYALCPRILRFYFHIMWLDAFISLPILALLTEKIIEKEKFSKPLFVFFYAITLLSNYYTAYMASVFILIYFFYYSFLKELTVGQIIKNIKDMAVSVILSVMLVSPILIPTFLQLIGGKLSNYDVSLPLKNNIINGATLVSSFIDQGYLFENLPVIFGSVVICCLILMYFTNSNISKKEKIASSFLFLFFALSLIFNPLYCMWHAFAKPEGFPRRFLFVIAFFTFIVIRKELSNMDNEKIIISLITLLTIYSAIFISYLKFNYLPWNQSSLKSSIISVCTVLILIVIGKKYKKFTSYSLSILLAFSCFFNGFSIMQSERKTLSQDNIPKANSYKENYLQTKNVIENICDEDKMIFRIEDVDTEKTNTAMAIGYNGISHFSSTFNQIQKNMFIHFGYEDTFYSTIYNHSNPLSDSIMGLKYVITKDETKIPENYEFVYKEEKSIYKNPYSFPIIYTGDTNNIDFNDNWYVHANNMSKTLENIDICDLDGNINFMNLEEFSNVLQAKKADILTFNGGYIECTAEGKYLLTSIMFDDNWKITVNGKDVEPEKYMEYFISVPLTEGENIIVMKYIPQGVNLGLIISLISVIIILISLVKNKKLRKEN